MERPGGGQLRGRPSTEDGDVIILVEDGGINKVIDCPLLQTQKEKQERWKAQEEARIWRCIK